MPRGGARPNSGGARPGAGRKPSDINERRRHLERLWYEAVTEDDHIAIIKKVVQAAKAGDRAAQQPYFDRVQGKPAQAVQFEGEAMQPLVVGIPFEVLRGEAEDADAVEGSVVAPAGHPALPEQVQSRGP